MSLHDLKILALENPFEINWDTVSNTPESEKNKFVAELSERLPVLEQLYLRLSTGQSPVRPGTPSALSYEDMEEALVATTDELVSTYAVLDTIARYNVIMDIIKS
jgi:hypothetical protein